MFIGYYFFIGLNVIFWVDFFKLGVCMSGCRLGICGYERGVLGEREGFL